MYSQVEWRLITSNDELNSFSENLLHASVIAVDTETTGLDPYTSELRLIQLAIENEPVLVIDCKRVLPKGREVLQQILGSKSVKVFQNAKFDLQFLQSVDIKVSGNIFDTMLAGQLLRSSGGTQRVGLAQLAAHYLEEILPKEQQTSDFSANLTESQLEYAAKDAEILLRLRNKMIPELKKNRLIEVARIEFACVYSIAYMEYAGIHLDLKRWEQLTEMIESERDQALNELYPYIGYPTVQLGMFESVKSSEINLNSNKQVLDLLKKYGMNVENTSKQALTQYLDEPIVKALLNYRHATKSLNTFLYGMPHQINPVTGRLHPHYSQNGAYSGRMSCGGPNIQQIPREDRFRRCFTAPKGRKLIIADYSQIELRVIAQFSQDQRMIEAYKTGEDLHKLTASLILEKELSEISKSERQAAKAVNFGLVFGMGAAGLKAYAADTYNSTMSLSEAETFKKRFFEGYRGVDTWHKKIKKELPREERTLSGRKFLFRRDSGMSGRYNAPVQGTAADILKNALGNLHFELEGKDTKIVAVVHDEIVLECPEASADELASLLTAVMENAGARYLRDVPVVAEASIADSWAGK